MKLFFQILILLFIVTSLSAQDPVTLNCLEVDDTGDVILRWIPESTNVSYHAIFYSTNGVSFDSIGNTPAVSFSYMHAGANADLGSRYYFIKTVFNNNFALSDTLRTIYLQVDNNDPDFNQADLFWNSIHQPFPDGYSEWYKVLREFPIGNWTLHDSVFITETNFSEPVIVCYDSITYRIIIENSVGCSSISNLRGAIFRDNEYPLEPFFDSVSINQDEYPVLGWSPSESEDVTGYIVYRFENNNWIEIERIDGRNSTFYIDSLSIPCNESFSYAIAALDSCANKSPGTFLEPLNTILLNAIEYDACAESNTIFWNDYLNAKPDLEAYRIYFSVNNGAFNLAGETGKDELVFTHTDIVAGETYTYFVQAIFAGGSSSSCKQTILSNTYEKPAFVYFANADVLPSNNIELTIDVDTSAKAYSVHIFRKDPQSNIYLKIDSLFSDEIFNKPLYYTDETADAGSGAFFYYADIQDSCDKSILSSNENKTIYLTAENINANQNLLQWNAFEGWDADASKYLIFRMINSVKPTLPIDSVNASILEYYDNISSLDNNAGNLVYWIQAVENEGNEFGYREKANSNRTSVAVSSDMFMANAFRPGGYTPAFKPVFRFYGGQTYLFQIYNRWGQLIFESFNPEQGWDGKHKGNNVPLGVYIYKLVYLNPDHQTVEKRGTVTVIY